jgi:CxxC-x17-CxxC domain-containing protein
MNQTIKESDLEDKTLVCVDCGNRFIWTAGEQKFFIDKGLQNIPKRCKLCAAAYKNKLREKHPAWWIKCKNCGKKTEVSFEPKSEAVYCQSCFEKEIQKRNAAIRALGEEVPA